MTECFKCHKEIFFNERFKTASGKKKPLDKTGEYFKVHDCPNKPFRRYNKYKSTRMKQFLAYM